MGCANQDDRSHHIALGDDAEEGRPDQSYKIGLACGSMLARGIRVVYKRSLAPRRTSLMPDFDCTDTCRHGALDDVGAMTGMARSTLPAIAEQELHAS